MALKHNPEPGDIYQHTDGSLYRVTGYQPSPTVHLEKMADGAGEADDQMPLEIHAVGCLNAEPFTKIGTFKKD